jgi:hypothetical protein
MRIISCLIFLIISSLHIQAQVSHLIFGEVRDQNSGESLANVSIQFFSGSKWSAIISNHDGRFSMNLVKPIDSIRFSMVGYHSFTLVSLDTSGNLDIRLKPMPSELEAVTVKPIPAIEIIRKAIAAIAGFLPNYNFSSRQFYREIIKDREHYFSVAEAIFLAQSDPAHKKVRIKLEKGRSKEEVSYTRLFEDFHPGGGPQLTNEESFLLKYPDFLNTKMIDLFQYSIQRMLYRDSQSIYCIAFDQKPGVKQSLEKGKIYIDADDFFILKYEAENSPLGMPYVKNLTGSDKIFAEILQIDFSRKGWSRAVSFSKLNNKSFLESVKEDLRIAYRQPKKNIDLDLTIHMDMMVTDPFLPYEPEISKDQEWGKKSLAVSLPSEFDSVFWVGHYIISPTDSIHNIIAALSAPGQQHTIEQSDSSWNFIHREMLLANKTQDTIVLSPIIKGEWEDESSAGMMYKSMEGDFIMESFIDLKKRTGEAERPDRGFQQAGLMIRKGVGEKENYFFLALGTGGSANPKLFFKKTIDSKTKAIMFHQDSFSGELKLVKSGSSLTAYFKPVNDTAWLKAGEFQVDWLSKKLQVGLAVFSHFPGQGPKMVPDLSAYFFRLKIQGI